MSHGNSHPASETVWPYRRLCAFPRSDYGRVCHCAISPLIGDYRRDEINPCIERIAL
jgi:hypothetical protein